MLFSTRRNIPYPNPDRSDAPDIPAHIKNLVDALELDVFFTSGNLSARPISTPGNPGIPGRIYVGLDQTPHTYDFDYGTGWDSLSGAQAPSFGTLALRPAASAGLVGRFYYATDQDSVALCDGTKWIRVGLAPGHIVWTAEDTAPTGYLIPAGQAWPSTTGIYADLFSKWGGKYPTLLPDMPGRQFVAKGTHADVNTIGFSDGISTVANRRPKHKTSIVQTVNGQQDVHGFSYTSGGVAGNDHGGSASSTIPLSVQPAFVGGPQTGAEPIDTAAYIVLNPMVKL